LRLIDLAGDAVAAKLGKVLAGEVAAVVIVLIVNIDHMDMLAAHEVAVLAAVGVPEKIFEYIWKILRPPAKQPHRVGVAAMQVARFEAWVRPREWADKAALDTLGDNNGDGWWHDRLLLIV
jgi:hypothetical protein